MLGLDGGVVRGDVAGAARIFREAGFLAIRGGFDPDLIGTLRDAFLARIAAAGHEDPGAQLGMQVGKSRRMVTVPIEGAFANPDLYANPLVLELMRSLLGMNMILSALTCITAFPGAGDQHFHRDHVDLFHEPEVENRMIPPYAVKIHIPLIDLDETTGSTAVVLCSHFRDTPPEKGESVPCYPKVGDLYVTDYRLWHHGTPNRSDQVRPILNIVYNRPWFVDVNNYNAQPNLDFGAKPSIPIKHFPLFGRSLIDRVFNQRQ